MIRKVAFAGDWHGDAAWAVKAMEYAKIRGAEVLLHVGDFGDMYHREFVGSLSSLSGQIRLPIMFLDGNHDDHRLLRNLPTGDDGLAVLAPGLTYIPRGHVWTWDGIKYMGLGGALSVDRWQRRAHNLPYWHEETLTARDVAAASSKGTADIMITHDAPALVPIPDIERRAWMYPDTELIEAGKHRQVVQRVVDIVHPRLLVHGHYHTYYHRTVEMRHGMMHVLGLDAGGSSLYRNVVVMDTNDLRRMAR